MSLTACSPSTVWSMTSTPCGLPLISIKLLLWNLYAGWICTFEKRHSGQIQPNGSHSVKPGFNEYNKSDFGAIYSCPPIYMAMNGSVSTDEAICCQFSHCTWKHFTTCNSCNKWPAYDLADCSDSCLKPPFTLWWANFKWRTPSLLFYVCIILPL